MKRNIIIKGMAALAVAGFFSACSDNYLDIEPVTEITTDQAMSTVPGVRVAVSGIFEAMNKQYQSLDFNGNCGEAYIGNACNDAFGPDLVSGLWSFYTSLYNWDNMQNNRTYTNIIPWMYYYGLIGQCNNIIANANMDEANYTESEFTELKFLLAQTYTMRAHAYQKLVGLYAPRWEDSKNGESYCIVLRTEPGTDPSPLVKVNDVFKQIYKDLGDALSLYAEAPNTKRANKWSVDASVAHGIFARAALMKHDWALAQQHAHAARQDYTVMDAKTYLAGFTDDCTDYIWHMNPDYNTTYYWSWGSHNACNGGYLNAWEFGAGAMNIDLYNTMDPNDVRRKLYLMPDKLSVLRSTWNPGKIKESDFWNEKCVDANNFLNLAFSDPATAVGGGPGMYNVALGYCFYQLTEVLTVDYTRFKADDNFFDYFYWFAKPDKDTDVLLEKGAYGRLVKIPFGAQYKFYGDVPYGNMAYPWMRASEMCLAEAEAYYELGNETEAKKCLTELMSKRVEGYTCKTSGTALRDEIRNTRRAELFMEGQSFTDYKRWNINLERREWKAGDTKSGNVAPGSGLTKEPSDNKGWCFAIPLAETQYNPAIDLSLLNN